MTRFAKPLLSLGVLAAVAACGPVNRTLESVHKPVVQRSDMAINLATQGDALAPGSAERLDGWFEAISLAYSDQVTIDDPVAAGAAGRRAGVAAVVARYGLLPEATPPVTPGNVTPGTLRVVVTRATASVPNCPDWSRMSQPEFASSTMSNFGCATRSNWAAAVADPNDLVTGTPYRGGEATSTVKAVNAWRKMEPTGSGTLQGTTVGGRR
jgi:pilus assembly protein CpaD